MTDLRDKRVAIIGLGLMGGSMAGALRGRCRAVIGVTHRSETVVAAFSHGLIDQGTTSLEDGLNEADIVILATPVRVILGMLSEIGPLLPPGCVVMDLGSTKSRVVAQMGELPHHVDPLGAHPMCGKETSGIEAADPKLYQDCRFVLAPLARTSKHTIALATRLVTAVGGNPLILDPERHDRAAAMISHLPYLLACSLVAATMEAGEADDLVWELAASGFRDTSRVAASDVTMMLDILSTNQEAVLAAIDTCADQLRVLRDMVAQGEEDQLRDRLTRIREQRKGMFL